MGSLETCHDSCEIVWTFFYFLICREPQNGRGSGSCKPEEVAGSERVAAADASQPVPAPAPSGASLLGPVGEREGSHGFRALPLPPLCLSILNNFPTCHTCSPVSHVAAGNTVWRKQLLLTLLHCHVFVTPPVPNTSHVVTCCCSPALTPHFPTHGLRNLEKWTAGLQEVRVLPSCPNEDHPAAREAAHAWNQTS